MNFWVISNFSDFLFCSKFLLLLLGLPWQYIGPHDEMSMIIPLLKSNSSFCCLATCQEWPKWTGSLQNWGKNHKKLKISQNSFCIFLRASSHVPLCFVPQKNSRTSMIMWLKGYSVIFTYDREISNQSGNTNRETPCSSAATLAVCF